MTPQDPRTLQTLFRWLTQRDLLWVHLPKPPEDPHGFADVLLFDPPRTAPLTQQGTAIFMEFHDPQAQTYRLTPGQSQWAGDLVDQGWEAVVGRTCLDVIGTLRRLGY